MSLYANLAADLLVAILLVATIVSSLRLSRRIAGLKANEAAMRQTIGDLVVATASAERAITGLRAALADGDRTLSERLDAAERSCADLAAHVQAGEGVIARIGAIVTHSQAARGPKPREGRPLVAPNAVSSKAGAPVLAVPSQPAVPEAIVPVPTVSSAVPSNGDRIGAALAAAQAISERALERIRARAA